MDVAFRSGLRISKNKNYQGQKDMHADADHAAGVIGHWWTYRLSNCDRSGEKTYCIIRWSNYRSRQGEMGKMTETGGDKTNEDWAVTDVTCPKCA